MTQRQAAILAAIIEQHSELSYPVGSVTLARLFSVSSSTIRAEMSQLEKLGYITQPHTSAGRIPTDSGYRWYVNEIVGKTEDISINQAKVFDVRVQSAGQAQQVVQSALESLVDITSGVAAISYKNHLHLSGLERLLGQPEFSQPDQVQAVAYLIDNLENWLREVSPTQPVSVFIGQENPIGKSSGCSLIFGRFKSQESPNSYIGLIGPTRQDYRQTVNLVDHARQVLSEVINKSGS